jgi:hypothetical protein
VCIFDILFKKVRRTWKQKTGNVPVFVKDLPSMMPVVVDHFVDRHTQCVGAKKPEQNHDAKPKQGGPCGEVEPLDGFDNGREGHDFVPFLKLMSD